jgi:hypothetical protein
MSSERQSDDTSRRTSIWQNERVRRVIIYAAVLLGAFLLGLVPMWLTVRERGRELKTVKATLQISSLQNTLASGAIDARQGRYEPARQAASDFFTNLRTEIDRRSDSIFTEAQQNALRPILDTRDDTITLLARGDPASSDRLNEIYNAYRQAINVGSQFGEHSQALLRYLQGSVQLVLHIKVREVNLQIFIQNGGQS